jgi:uncharacterized membrane-anchored protein YhcB (DUF1043 family)
MTSGLVVLVGSLLVIFGVLIGSRLCELQLTAQVRRQAAVQRALNKQREQLQVARYKSPFSDEAKPWDAEAAKPLASLGYRRS